MNAILPIQIILLLFFVFAISRVMLRLREGSLALGAFIFWLAIFSLAGIFVIDPALASLVAVKIGIQRGTDVIVYLSLTLLFYLIFRLNIYLENLRNEISRLTREIAIRDKNKK